MKFSFIPVLLLSGVAMAAPPEEEAIRELRKAIEERDALKAKLAEAEKKVVAMSRQLAGEPAVPAGSEVAITRASEFLEKRGLKVRRSVKDKAQGALPATFQFTRTPNAKDSRAADVGVSIEGDVPWDLRIGQMSWGLFAEYHHLSETKVIQDGVVKGLANGKDSLLLGGSADLVTRAAHADDAHLFRSTLAYKRDKIVSGEGLLTDLSWLPYFPNHGIGNHWGYEQTNGWIEGRIEPFVGLQYEEGNGAKGFRDGTRFSARAGFNLGLRLLPAYLGNRLTLDSKLMFWDHLDTKGVYSSYDDEQWYLASSLTYWFYTPGKASTSEKLAEEDQHLGISVGYTWGDNPEEGQLDADILTFGLSIKY